MREKCRLAPTLLLTAACATAGHWSTSTAQSSPSLTLAFPVDCELHAGCTIQNYFDHDPGPGFQDYRCGKLGYNGHDGIDIRLPHLRAMRQGVLVLAAADGVVRATRDRMPDVNVREAGKSSVKGLEAGNAVVLRHGDDWETQYSHLLRGSVLVQPGKVVNRGDPLGRIGLSGNTEFPHLHFEIRYRGEPVDPFVGLQQGTACQAGSTPLWSPEALDVLGYRPTGLLQAGFSSTPPDRRGFASGLPEKAKLSSAAPAMIFAVEVYGAQKDDLVTMRIIDPDKATIATQSRRVPGHKARWASYLGRKRPRDGWPTGTYIGKYELQRQGKSGTEIVLEVEQRIRVPGIDGDRT